MTWKTKVSKANVLLFQLQASVRGIKENESGLSPTTYPTPTRGMYKQDVKDNGEYARRIKEKGHQIMLPAFVKLYPTPRAADVEGGAVKNVQLENGHFFRENSKGVRWGVKLRDAVEMFPTPMARDHKDINFNTTWKLGNKSQNTMARQVLKDNKPGGKLNPNFVELLMGYPMNWTKIDPTE
jgi:DNA (cytosine-5)-methyltransferase 1